MCELFGVSSAERIEVNRFLRELMSHSVNHPNGWGMATFFKGGVNIEKEPKSAWVSDYVHTRLEHPICAKNLIAHIRLATQGSMAYENCHPFVDRDKYGTSWTLAHNGTIFQSEILDKYRSIQEGGTDSERILCHIISKINSTDEADAERKFEILDDIVCEIAEHNKVNLLIFDGEVLYVHTNMKGTLYISKRGNSALLATVPLDEGEWEPLPMMQLLAYKDGNLLYEGTRHNFEYFKPDALDTVNQCSGL